MAEKTSNIDDDSVDHVRVLTLNNGEHQDGIQYRVKKGWQIEFRLGPSLFGKFVDVFTNHPPTADQQFDRHTYYQLRWENDVATMRVMSAGSFHYYTTDAKGDSPVKAIASGYLLVEPELQLPANGGTLPLDCVQCQTVLSKCLGPFSTWESKLVVARNSGYNMIHFTPIQELGASQSAYSLSDQLKLNPSFNDDKKMQIFA